MNYDRNKVERVKREYPPGTRIKLQSLCNDERDMPPGLCGTVIGCDDQPALLMKWDNGRSLSLLPFDDSFIRAWNTHWQAGFRFLSRIPREMFFGTTQA